MRKKKVKAFCSVHHFELKLVFGWSVASKIASLDALLDPSWNAPPLQYTVHHPHTIFVQSSGKLSNFCGLASWSPCRHIPRKKNTRSWPNPMSRLSLPRSRLLGWFRERAHLLKNWEAYVHAEILVKFHLYSTCLCEVWAGFSTKPPMPEK